MAKIYLITVGQSSMNPMVRVQSQMSKNITDTSILRVFSDIFEDVLAPELEKIELSLVAENKEKEEAKQKENMKIKFEALTSSSVLDDYSNSDSSDYRQESTISNSFCYITFVGSTVDRQPNGQA